MSQFTIQDLEGEPYRPATYITAPANAAAPLWCRLGAIWVSAEPLRDITTNLYARFTYRDALAACAFLGCRLPTFAEVDTIRDDALKPGGILLAPVTLPDAHILHDAGVDPRNEAAIDTLRNARMAGEAWCRYHDAAVKAQMTTAGWDGTRPAMNCGKWYAGGAPPGWAWLIGWWVPATHAAAAHYIQQGHEAPGQRGPHTDIGSRDYATLTMVARDTPPPLETPS